MGVFLSIVIPVYNAAPYLPAMLDGILAAGLSSAELLLVDDGSTDGSLRICRTYAEREDCVRVFRQNNAGPSAARNLGIAESRGDYIAFFDADDLIDPEAFRRTVNLLPLPDAQFWVSDFSRVAVNGCTLDRIRQIEDRAEPIAELSYMRRFLSDGERVWNVWRYIFRRDFLLAHDLYFVEGVNCAEDVEFIVRVLLCAEKPVFFHNPYYFYRAHYGDTLTRQYTAGRIRDLAEMLTLSEAHLAGRKDACSRLLRDKLVKEYLLNISICAEIPKEDRPAALSVYEAASPLLEQAESKKLRAAGAFVRRVGIRGSARLLLALKKGKRWIRKRKIERFGKANP